MHETLILINKQTQRDLCHAAEPDVFDDLCFTNMAILRLRQEQALPHRFSTIQGLHFFE